MADSSEIFQRVRDAVDIVEIIGEHVALKRAGREFKGLCPFHEDHRPSMAVVPHKQIFHCFVCGTGGDVFKFVREYHKMSAGEALRMLAQRGGVKLPELPKRGGSTGNEQEGPSVREQIAATNDWACDYFEKLLRAPSGRSGLDYLHSRGLTDETIERFRLGMSPDGWTGLVNAAMRLQIPMEKLDQAGLVKKRHDGSAYDAFRGRVMFPIIDATGGGKGGRVIAFGGRVLEEKRDEQGVVVEAKYLNTGDTRLFNKSESIYGLNLARQHIVRTRIAVVVEGYMDVIACHQVGVTNVIATLGTALTEEHARMLKNYAQTIVLVFDSDDAGRRAANRAMEVFVGSPLDIKITSVPDGKDPCDFCIKNGGDAFQKLIDSAVDALTFQWNRVQQQVQGTDSVARKQEAIAQFMRFAAAAMAPKGGIHSVDPIRRGQLIVKLSRLVGLPLEDVTQLLYSASYKESPKSPPKKEEVVDEAAKFRRQQEIKPGRSGEFDAPRWLVGCLLAEPAQYWTVREDLDINIFADRFKFIAEIIFGYFEDIGDPANCTLAGFSDYVESLQFSTNQADLARWCAYRWEQMVGDWIDPVHLSSQQAKLVVQWREMLGHDIAMVVRDCVAYLRLKSGKPDSVYEDSIDPIVEVEDPEARELAMEIAKAVKVNRKGGNLRNVGWGNNRSMDPGLMERMQQREVIAERVLVVS